MKDQITGLIALLRELQKIDPEFPLQYAICLAEIAVDEGLSLTQLAAKAGMPLSTVSRIVGALSSQRQRGAPYGLVRAMVVPHERRRKQLYLTTRGRAVANALAAVMAQDFSAAIAPAGRTAIS